MDASSVCSGLIRWLETFPGLFAITVDSLADGVVMGTVLNIIDPSHFTEAWASRLKQDCGDNWRLKVSNLRKIQQSVVEYLQLVNVQYADHTLPDLNKIGETACPEEVGRMLQLILGCAMNCQYKERYIESIMVMPAEVQAVVMNTLQTVFMRDSSPGAEVAGPASFHPNHRTIAEQLETTTRARDEAVARVHELEMQLSEDSEERKELSEENAKLMERLIGLEDASELGGTGTASRYKDLKKKIDSLQDDLFKVETSRDEYRSRVEVLEREHAEMLQRSEELQRLADQAHRLQDEVDVLRDMGQRATVAETTIESYKKKLDELSDLRRQNKILEQKNADYLTHILELEEDVKKNDSWRPQLELFKKQVAELRQQLAEVTKKSDRLNFDNKKLTEKVEAITVEKDRVAFERDGLKENVEELRCQRSADPRGDLPRADLLSTDPQDVWEKLMRLQHENQQLKKQQQEGGQSEPVLQAMLSELQERHNCTSVENRWDAAMAGTTAPHSSYCSSHHRLSCTPPPDLLHQSPSSSLGGSSASSSMAFFDAYNNLDSPRKIKLLRKNLKWASESDLLIFRQPSLFSSIFSSFSGKGHSSSKHSSSNVRDQKALTLSNNLGQSARRRPYSDGSQHIVIRHIHEFKMPASPTGLGSTEDSGCCRTSPSSCEGCDDGPATMDSGVSGLYDCITPVIPTIAEDCTSQHLSDVFLPHTNSLHPPTSLLCNGSFSSSSSCSPSSTIMHHMHCCSPPPTVDSNHSHSCSSRSPSRRGRNESFSHISRMLSSQEDRFTGSYGGRVVSESKTQSTSGVSLTSSSPAKRPVLRASLPPDSPTPHNSPRIPSRITATRKRSSRSSLSPSQSSYSSMSESEPVQTSNRRPYRILQRSQSETVKDAHKPTLTEMIRPASRNCFSSSNESLKNLTRSPTPDDVSNSQTLQEQKNAYNSKVAPQTTRVNASNLIKCQASISADHIPVGKVEEINVCQSFSGLEISPTANRRSFSFRGQHSKPVSVVRGVAAAIRHPVAAQANNNNSSNDSLFSSLSSQNTSNGSIQHNPALSPNADNTASLLIPQPVKNEEINFIDLNKESKVSNTVKSSPFLISSVKSTSPDRCSPTVDSCSISSNTSDISFSDKSESEVPEKISRNNSLNLETHFGMHDLGHDDEPITVVKPFNKSPIRHNIHVTFKEPVAVNINKTKSNNSTLTQRKPTEIGKSNFNRSSSKRVCKPQTVPDVSDVTLLQSDTLFTNFVVSPRKCDETETQQTIPSPSRFQHYHRLNNAATVAPINKALILPYMDSDEDEDVLEHRLVAGAYCAPLVSSESCTSVSHDDNNDTDPSATEYNTDNGSDTYDFNPLVYRLNYDELQKDRQHMAMYKSAAKLAGSSHRNSLSSIREEVMPLCKTRQRAHVALLTTTVAKIKKQEKFHKSSSLVAIKKKKHKTAKMFASETFNAMFTFCTP